MAAVTVGTNGVVVTTVPVKSTVITVGTPGKPGPIGPQGGTPVVPVEYADWPPDNPVPDTLYLRLAP